MSTEKLAKEIENLVKLKVVLEDGIKKEEKVLNEKIEKIKSESKIKIDSAKKIFADKNSLRLEKSAKLSNDKLILLGKISMAKLENKISEKEAEELAELFSFYEDRYVEELIENEKNKNTEVVEQNFETNLVESNMNNTTIN